MKRFGRVPFAALLVLALVFVVAASGATSRTWVNDFERPGDDTPAHDWWADVPTTIKRTPSGAAATYASGIASAHGRWHARTSPNRPCPKTPVGPACDGPYTYWGKRDSSSNPTITNPNLPDGGYVTEIDVYLDVPWMAQDPVNRFDTRFDWDSAINDASGSFRSDYIFNAGTPLTPMETGASPGYYVNASTNGNRSGAFPENTCPNPAAPPNYCRAPVKITQSGWYTFRHYFHVVTIGGIQYLAVDMSVRAHDAVIASWTIYSQAGLTGVGGDAYGWFVINEIQDLAIDCSALHSPNARHPALGAQCAFPTHSESRCDRNDDSDRAEHDEYEHMNKERKDAGMQPLTMNTASSDAARKHACDRRDNGDDGERGSNGSTSADRMRSAGVPFTVNAENNGYATGDTVAEALDWIDTDILNDVAAKANVLNPAFTQVGIGAVYIDGEMYLTEDFTG